jgi:hypothetical protein
MAVDGKKKIQVYVVESDYEYIKSFIETTRHKGGMSGFFDSYLRATARTLRAANYVQGKKLTLRQIVKLGLAGLKEDLA